MVSCLARRCRGDEEKDPSIKVIESYEAYNSARAEPVARQMLDAGANVLLLSTFVLSDVAKTLAPEYKQVPMGVTSFGVTMQPNSVRDHRQLHGNGIFELLAPDEDVKGRPHRRGRRAEGAVRD